MPKKIRAYGTNASTIECTLSRSGIEKKKAKSDQLATSADQDSKLSNVKDDVVAPIKEPKKKKLYTKGEAQQVTFVSLFRFSDALDAFLMILGTLLAMAVGVATPLTVYYYGQLISQFVAHSQVKRLNQSLVIDIQSGNDSDSICYQQILTRPRESFESLMGNESEATSLLDAVFVPEVVGFIIITASVIVFGYFAMLLWLLTTERQVRRIRLALFNAVMRQDISWFDAKDIRALNTHMFSDVEKIRQGLGEKMATFVRWMTTFISSFILCLVQSWKLALVVMATTPLLILAVAVMGRVVRIFIGKELRAYAPAGAVATEILTAIRTVAAFGGEVKAVQKYQMHLGTAKMASIRRGIITGFAQASIWLYRLGSVALTFWYGGKLIRDECLEAGVVLGVFFIIITGIMSLSNAVPLLDDFSNARLAAVSLFKIIDTDSSDYSQYKSDINHSVVGEIEFEDVVFTYSKGNNGCQVINGLNLKIGAGQTVALVGPTGCGKSTILHLLQRLYDPQSGTVKVDDMDIKQLSIHHLRGHIGFVDQNPVIFDATVEDNIRLGGVNVTDADIKRAIREANCEDFINRLPKKLQTHVGDSGTKLSASEKHRVVIARALVSNPKILLLDAVTSVLDPESEAVVQTVLEKVSKGRTTIMIPHTLSTAQHADVIFGIREGSVVERGTHDELMSSQGLYYSMKIHHQNESTSGVLISSSTVRHTNSEQAESTNMSDELQQSTSSSKTSEQSSEPAVELETRSLTEDVEMVNQTPETQDETSGGFSRYDAMRTSLRSLHSVIPEPVFEEERNTNANLKSEIGKLMPRKATKNVGLFAPTPFGHIGYVNQPQTSYVAVGGISSLALGAAQPFCALSLNEELGVTTASGKPAYISFSRVLQMNRAEAFFLAVGSLASLALGAVQPIFALALSGEFGSFAIMFRPLEREQLIGFWSGMMMVIGVGAAVAVIVQSLAFAISGERLTERLRLKCFQAIIKQEVAWFDLEKNNVGALTSLLAGDASVVKTAVGLRLGTVAQSVACIVTAMIIAYTGDWRLALVATAIFPVTVAGSLLPARVLTSQALARRTTVDQGSKIYKDVIMNIKTVMRLRKESYFTKKFEDHCRQLYRYDVSNASVYSIVYSFSQCTFTTCFAVCYSFGAFLVGAYDVPPFKILRVFGSLVVGGITVGQVLAASPDFIRAIAAATKIKSLLSRKSEIDPLHKFGLELDSCSGSVSFSNVAFRFPRSTTQALQGFSVEVSPDECLALVDISGCDKSAVIALLERFYDPPGGRAALDGYRVQNINIQCLRRNLGLVTQEANLFNDSVAENIAYGDNERQVTMNDIISAAQQVNIHDFICSLPQGYATKLGDKGPELSDGHKRCLALARVLVRKPKVLLIDDVATSYGAETELVDNAMKKVQEGRTCIIATQRLSTLKNAHKIGVISEGKIAEIGTHDELMALGKLYFNFVLAHEI